MLRIGVIRCGGMGRDHIKRIAERTQGAKVVAVSDVFEEGAKKAAEIAGGAKVYTDGKALINDPEVDAVLIVSPGFVHCEDLLEVIKVGKRVFFEKPLCTTADDCKRVMEAEEASGKHLIKLGFMRRYHKGYNQIKDAIATGEYGKTLMMYCTHRNPEVGTNYNTPMAPTIRKNAQYSTEITTDCFVLFKDAYDAKIQNWVDCAEKGVIEGPATWDGYLAAVTADALVKAQETGNIEKVVTVEKPEFYK